MSVINPRGFINNVLKKGKVKDLHRFSESVCQTCDEAADAQMFRGDWSSDIEFITRKRDVYKTIFSSNVESIAQRIWQFVHDPSVNKIVFEDKTFLSDDKVKKPMVDGEIIRISTSEAAFLVEYMFVKMNADTQTALWSCAASSCKCFIAISTLSGAWRLYFVPEQLQSQVKVGIMTKAGIDVELAEVLPGGCTFLEMQCLRDGWKISSGVNITSRCDVYIDTASIRVLVRPMVDPIVQAEIQALHTVISSARRLFETTIAEESEVRSKVLSKDLISFIIVEKK